MDLRDGKVFCGSTDPVSVGQRLVAKRGPVAPAIVGVPRFSLAFGERKAGRGKNAECELRLAIKSRSHRHGAGGELKSTLFEQARMGSTNRRVVQQAETRAKGACFNQRLSKMAKTSRIPCKIHHSTT